MYRILKNKKYKKITKYISSKKLDTAIMFLERKASKKNKKANKRH
tara:strand:+ start:406 stop:540 length:135 start_codon:yes stop_codon:yes gene_type:complete